MAALFLDRYEAGRRLAEALFDYALRDDVVVLALPRGGVPVGFEVARRLTVRFDVFVVRKLGVPREEELAMGAIASGGVRVLNDAVVRDLPSADVWIRAATERESKELERREFAYRAGRPFPNLAGTTVILVDDGLATGSTMYAAMLALRKLHPAKIIVAVPVAPTEACALLEREVHSLICLAKPDDFHAVGQFYTDFTQTTDAEVTALMTRAAMRHQHPASRS
jgi:putative phosphoribosyl transferase